jgi:hypothetical protein
MVPSVPYPIAAIKKNMLRDPVVRMRPRGSRGVFRIFVRYGLFGAHPNRCQRLTVGTRFRRPPAWGIHFLRE